MMLRERGSSTPGRIRLLLFSTPEGRVLLAGLLLTVTGLLLMALVATWSPRISRMIGALAFSNIIFGRAVSMSIGYAAGYGHSLVLSVNMVTETILVLLFYPVFVFSVKKLVVFSWSRKLLEHTNTAAIRHKDKVRKYGVIGLFTFVWFPFWMTGPVVGSAIGYLIRFPAWLTLTAVLAGTYIAMVAWALFLFDLQKRMAVFGGWAPALLVGIIIAIVALGYLAIRKQDMNHPHGEE